MEIAGAYTVKAEGNGVLVGWQIERPIAATDNQGTH